MENLKIMVCCGAGMSSGMLAKSARKAAKQRKLEVSIEARSESEVHNYLPEIDILMLGPHFSGYKDTFSKMAESYSVPVVVIPQNIYGMLDGSALIDLAFTTINNKGEKE